jgi:hypothetical protein
MVTPFRAPGPWNPNLRDISRSEDRTVICNMRRPGWIYRVAHGDNAEVADRAVHHNTVEVYPQIPCSGGYSARRSARQDQVPKRHDFGNKRREIGLIPTRIKQIRPEFDVTLRAPVSG